MVYTATDKEQMEEIKKWWNDYGKAIAIAVVIGLIIGFGWRYWSRYHTAEIDSASFIYQAQLQYAAKNDAERTIAVAAELQNKFSGTVYASMGSLIAARMAAHTGKYSEASTLLSWVIQKGKVPAFQQIARIRDARVLLQMKEPTLAMQVISTVSDKQYQPMIDAVKGEIYQAQGNTKAAQAAFAKAKAGYQAAGIENPFLQLRLAD